MDGPDGALVEYVGDFPAEHFDHVHLWQEDPFPALDWCQTHMNALVRAGFTPPTAEERKLKRGPDRSWPSLTQIACSGIPKRAWCLGTWC